MNQNRKHLTLDDRVRIQHYLEEGYSIRYIADRLDKSPSTISRELKKHSKIYIPSQCDCQYFSECIAKHVCGSKSCNGQCRKCSKAKKHCNDYVKIYCDILLETPSKCCNKCKKFSYCHYEKRRYLSNEAQKSYTSTLTNSRNGYDCTYDELCRIDNIVSPLIKQGQSIYHIMQNHKDELPISESTLRRMIHGCELECRNIDMRSVVQRKVRVKRTANDYKKSKISKHGHMYEDYLAYIKDNEDISVVEMDCVEGSKDSSATLLTLHFVQVHMQLALIMDSQTKENVIAVLDMLEEALGKELFRECFPLILTDNGSEFEDIAGMECSIYGGQRTKVFFCEPNRSDEKGACENNHKYIRYIIPKGTNMDDYRQAHIHLAMNHINSYCRKSLFGKSPYDLAMGIMPEDFFILLGLEKIPADEVILRPSLLKTV